jgi:outer membrane protein
MKNRLLAPVRVAALTGAAAASFLIASPASAQDADGGGWLITVGAGPQVGPKFPGSDSYGISPMPIFGLRRPGDPIPVETADEGFGIGLMGRNSRFNIGPVLQLVNKRDPEDVGAAVPEVDISVEVGAFVEAYPAPWLRLRVEGRKAVTGHDGWNGDILADFVVRGGDTTVFTIGPRARIGDRRYHQAYFGVTPAVAAATGLPAYAPSGGFHSYGVNAGLTHQFSPSWGIYAYAGYDRLVRDAADSPIVRDLGSRDQFSGGIGLSYTFRTGSR